MTLLRSGWVFRGVLTVPLLWPGLAWILARGLIVSDPTEKADAIAVFSGAATYHERTGLAAELYIQSIAPIIILTNDGGRGGWSRSEHRNPYFEERAAQNLESLGALADGIKTLSPVVDSTYSEALSIRDYATLQNLHSIIFVTSAYHTRRARWTVNQVFYGTGIKVSVIGVRPGVDTPSPFSWWLSFGGWRFVAGEWVKLVYYHCAY